MKKNKVYTGIMKIHKEISEENLKKRMQKFVGKIKQKPPVKSRVKREERERSVYYWELVEFDKEKKEALFECEVEAGTYVRKLISVMGENIGGAHMLELRRIKAGIFSEKDKNFVNLYKLERLVKENKLKQILIPAEEAIKRIMPVIQVKEEAVKKLLTGKPIFKEDLAGKIEVKAGIGEDFVVFSGLRFIGVYEKVGEKKIIAKSKFVFN